MDRAEEMRLFQAIAGSGSLSAAARDLDLSLGAVSKRLAALETRLGVRLINRTTRRMTLTDEGQTYLQMASEILAGISRMEEAVSARASVPSGLLRVNSAIGFGRMHVAPAISEFAGRYPELRVQLQLTEHPLNLVEANYDVGIRIGLLPDARIVARRIFDNRLLACASPAYLKRRGKPRTLADLRRHDCIVLRENRDDYATWHFTGPDGRPAPKYAIKVNPRLSANDGQIAVRWALDGHGIVLRSEYEVGPLIAEGRLVQVLAQHRPVDFSIYACHAQRRNTPAKIRAFIDFLAERFADSRRTTAESAPVRRRRPEPPQRLDAPPEAASTTGPTTGSPPARSSARTAAGRSGTRSATAPRRSGSRR